MDEIEILPVRPRKGQVFMDEIEILPVRLGKGTFICYDDDFAWVDYSN